MEATIVGILPNREPGAGGAPGGHDFVVGPLADSHPFEKIDDQGFDSVDHEVLSRSPQYIALAG